MDNEVNNKIKVIEAELNKTKEENKELQDELNETKEHLKKYTAPKRSKKFYELHKDDIKQKSKDYRTKTNYTVPKEKKKEYNRKAYLNRVSKQDISNNEILEATNI